MESQSEVRVRYAETDQMGVAYHANYLVWCEIGRTDFIRKLGVTYAEMEAQGIKLAVADASLRYHASAKYDDRVRISTRLTEVRSRMIAFEYLLERLDEAPNAADPAGSAPLTPAEPVRLASARTTLVSINDAGRPVAIPPHFRALLDPARSDPTR